jgi:hypothetical protein
MAADRSYVAQNDRARERLRGVVTRLSDSDLQHPLDAGRTVAGVLGHLAFWDQRIFVLLESWERAGLSAVPRQLNHDDVDWINDAAKPILLAVAPRRAAELVLAVAEAVDRKAEGLAEELVTRNAEAGSPVNLLRATHRAEHLDQIELALGR